MIQHFNNLQTPLKSIHRYPKMTDQQQRFLEAGWSSVMARNLWDLWTDNSIVSPQEKIALDAVESFDEWEEFVLFASHYFVLLAAGPTCEGSALAILPKLRLQESPLEIDVQTRGKKSFSLHSDQVSDIYMRKFGAALPISQNVFGHYGGMGSQTRLGNVGFYGPAGSCPPKGFDVAGIEPRMCHTVSAAGLKRCLLVGGRTSPANVLKDCWILCECSYRVDDLPIGLYRHSSTQVILQKFGQECSGVLIYGGKTGKGQVSDRWFLWRDAAGWAQVDTGDCSLTPRFGAAMVSMGSENGLLIGGMNCQGTILSEVWEWSIVDGQENLSIRLECIYSHPEVAESEKIICDLDGSSPLLPLAQSVVGRMGACLVDSSIGLLLIGGVTARALSQDFDIIRLEKTSRHQGEDSSWYYSPIIIQSDDRRPLLVGHTTLSFDDSVIIMGGGAVCFSFGAHWNQSISTLTSESAERVNLGPLRAKVIPDSLQGEKRQSRRAGLDVRANKPTKIEYAKVDSAQDFEYIIDKSRPVIISGSSLGSCTNNWTLDVLKAKVGFDRSVSIGWRICFVPY